MLNYSPVKVAIFGMILSKEHPQHDILQFRCALRLKDEPRCQGLFRSHAPKT